MKRKGDGTYLKKNRKRYAFCNKCRKEYNISILKVMPKYGGYECPKCATKRRNNEANHL